MSDVLTRIEAGVASVILNRPARMNAWTPGMELALQSALRAVAADPAVRVILLTGAGRAFCAGADIGPGGFGDGDGTSPFKAPPPRAGDWNQRYSYIAAIDKPVVAAINGAAAGVGLVLSLFADIRLVAPSAKLTTAFAQRGLIAEHGSAWLLPRLIGEMRAAELLFTGRLFTGAEAGAMGLAIPLPDEDFPQSALNYCRALAQNSSPRATSLIKQQLRAARGQSLAEATQLAEAMLESCEDHPDLTEGIAHWLEKRPAQFRDFDPQA